VKLSFAHAEGRNYRQLPARARLREEPSPADIFYLRDMPFQACMLVARGVFRHGSTCPKVTRFGMRVGTKAKGQMILLRLCTLPKVCENSGFGN
jgi:hypothetical protein